MPVSGKHFQHLNPHVLRRSYTSTIPCQHHWTQIRCSFWWLIRLISPIIRRVSTYSPLRPHQFLFLSYIFFLLTFFLFILSHSLSHSLFTYILVCLSYFPCLIVFLSSLYLSLLYLSFSLFMALSTPLDLNLNSYYLSSKSNLICNLLLICCLYVIHVLYSI